MDTNVKRPPFATPEGSWNRMPVIYVPSLAPRISVLELYKRTMMTNALPLKNRAYRLEIRPTAKAPTAAEISLWLGNLRPVK